MSNSNEVSCIDHAYTNRRFRCSQPVSFPFGDSDHNLIGYTRFSKEPPRPSKTVRKRSYKTFSECNFIADLSAVDWCEVYSSRDVDVAVEAFTAKYLSVLNLHAPWIIFQLRKNYSPWISEETLALMKQRDNAKNVAANLVQDGRDAADAWKIFKKLRNQVNNKRKQEEKNYKKSLIEKSLCSTTSTWKTAKMLMDWNDECGPPEQLSVNGLLVTKSYDIAKIMNSYFVKKVQKIHESINHVQNEFQSCLKIMSNKSCNLSMQFASVSKVNKLLKSLKNSKSSAVDGLDNFCLKISADIIDKPLHHIISLSIQQMKFPTA